MARAHHRLPPPGSRAHPRPARVDRQDRHRRAGDQAGQCTVRIGHLDHRAAIRPRPETDLPAAGRQPDLDGRPSPHFHFACSNTTTRCGGAGLKRCHEDRPSCGSPAEQAPVWAGLFVARPRDSRCLNWSGRAGSRLVVTDIRDFRALSIPEGPAGRDRERGSHGGPFLGRAAGSLPGGRPADPQAARPPGPGAASSDLDQRFDDQRLVKPQGRADRAEERAVPDRDGRRTSRAGSDPGPGTSRCRRENGAGCCARPRRNGPRAGGRAAAPGDRAGAWRRCHRGRTGRGRRALGGDGRSWAADAVRPGPGAGHAGRAGDGGGRGAGQCGADRGRAGHRQVRPGAGGAGRGAGLGCQVFWGTGDELGQALPLQPLLDALRVREPSANPRRNTIVRLLRGEVAADHGADGRRYWPSSCWPSSPSSAPGGRPSWSSMICSGPTRPASGCGPAGASVRQMPLLLVGMMRPVPRRDDLLALRRAVGDDARLAARRAHRRGGGRPGGGPGRRSSPTAS